MNKFKQIRIPEDELCKHCKNGVIQMFNLCTVTVKEILKPKFWKRKEISPKNFGFEIPEKRQFCG